MFKVKIYWCSVRRLVEIVVTTLGDQHTSCYWVEKASKHSYNFLIIGLRASYNVIFRAYK